MNKYIQKKLNKLTLIPLLFLCTQTNATVLINNIPENNEGCWVNHKCEIHALHTLRIYNETDKPVSYKYIHSLCVQNSPESCDYRGGSIVVPAHQTWINNTRTEINPYFRYFGNWDLTVITDVSGAEKKKETLNFKIRINK